MHSHYLLTILIAFDAFSPATDTDPKLLAVLHGHTNSIWSVALSADGRALVSSGFDKTIRVWDLPAGKERLAIRGHSSCIEFVAITPDGKLVVGADQAGVIRVWDTATAKMRAALTAAEGRPRFLHLTADGLTLSSGSRRGNLRQWDLNSARELTPVKFKILEQVRISPDGKLLAAKEEHMGTVTLRVMQMPAGTELLRVARPGKPLAFSPDGKTLFAHDGDSDTIHFTEIATGKTRGIALGLDQSHIGMVAVHPHGRILAIPREDATAIRLFDLATCQPFADLKVGDEEILSLAFSADGSTFAASEGPDSTIRVWDVKGIVKTRPPLKELLDERDLETLWTDLGSEDAAKAFRAIWTLAGAPKQAVPLMSRRLLPVTAADEQVTTPLLSRLNDRRFYAREEATRALEHVGEPALPALQARLANTPPAETRRRIEALIARLEPPAATPDRLRTYRAIEALEHAATFEARFTLLKLAHGIPEALQTREAKAALERLARRGPRQES